MASINIFQEWKQTDNMTKITIMQKKENPPQGKNRRNGFDKPSTKYSI